MPLQLRGSQTNGAVGSEFRPSSRKTSVLTTVRMILAGLAGVVLVEIYAAVMQRQFQGTDNAVGKGFTVLGIYLFAVIYCTCSSNEVLLLN